MRVELFPQDEDVDGLAPAEALKAWSGDPEQALRLAWAWRQSHVSQSRALLDAAAEGIAAEPAWQARAETILAEQAQLEQRHADAATLIARAEQRFQALNDPLGLADVLLVRIMLAFDRGENDLAEALAPRAIAAALQAGDLGRRGHLQLMWACSWVSRDQRRAAELAEGLLPPRLADAPLALQATMAQYLAMQETQQGDFASAIHHFVLGHHAALASGQLRRAIMSCCSAAFCFGQLLDPGHALEWIERGLALARDTGWPAQIANCRYMMGQALFLLGRFDAAREVLEEVLLATRDNPGLPVVGQAEERLGRVLLQQGQAAEAAQLFDRLQHRALSQQYSDLEAEALDGLAQAQLALGDDVAARQSVQRALDVARRHGYASGALMALKTLAQIERSEPATALQVLQQAEGLSQASQGLKLGADLLVAMADAYAAQGRHAEAFAAERRAREVAAQQASDEAQQRALAMQAHLESQRLSQENEHLRQLARSNAERIALLDRSQETLQAISRIGQEITATLLHEHLFERLSRHLRSLLPVNAFTVYRLNAEAQRLEPLHAAEDGRALLARRIPLDDPNSFAAACVRERQLLQIDSDGVIPSRSQIPGASIMCSLMFAPLQLGERIIGAMSLQSRQRQAFGERELAIFRSLSAYLAVALDNAQAYAGMAQMQHRLAEQQKLAALGSLVAGVAHELNTPVGNSLLAASTLQDGITSLRREINGQQLRRSSLSRFLDQSDDGLAVILSSMRNASTLVRSFKELAVSRETHPRERFRLDEVCRAGLAAQQARYDRSGIELQCLLPSGLEIDSHPTALVQVLSILLDNALVHAFGEQAPEQSGVRIEARIEGEQLQLSVRDNGRGIDDAMQTRVFEPFFTSRFGQGGNGLGLAVARNLVHGVLGGDLSLRSAPGQGSEFLLLLPLQAPAA
ncbi:HAMP domain-containing sensor histidine kinase [Paucibacter sp. APW11]|uniref:histidine kinase n=1 Tax=Roseateles aquae TaxID=3077235 RepID=A0ABU3PBX9_9BURK|nr:HAMP domain-containing sensor histidine kinase [Paucibacter sp. APW11]MDT8999780.1 HAMP domain-containing sensor histidine kinase [Paucibacter sp. APW11]